jgi:hypothetical protein
MTFEYRDADGGHLSVSPLPGVPYVLVRTDPEGCAVPADLVPDAIAGIRDAARQAVGQASTIEPDVTGTAVVTLATPCDNCDHALNWHSSQANCVVAFCGCGRFRPPARTASGQQPEATRVGRCPVMFQGGGRCEKDADHRAGRWPDDPHTPEPAPAVGQPAEAQATNEAVARVQAWIASDPVTARSEFGNGYREALRDITDVINRRQTGKDER